MKLTEKLITLREKRGLTQEEVAELMDVSRQAVSRWEMGTSIPNVEKLNRLSGIYGVPLSSLLDDEKELPCQEKSGKEDEAGEPQVLPPIQEDRNRKKIIKWYAIAVCILALLAIVAILAAFGNRGDSVPINDMPEEEVEIVPGTGFDFNNLEANE